MLKRKPTPLYWWYTCAYVIIIKGETFTLETFCRSASIFSLTRRHSYSRTSGLRAERAEVLVANVAQANWRTCLHYLLLILILAQTWSFKPKVVYTCSSTPKTSPEAPNHVTQVRLVLLKVCCCKSYRAACQVKVMFKFILPSLQCVL